MKIKEIEVTKKSDTVAVIDYYGAECTVCLRAIEIGGNTVTAIMDEDATVVLRSMIKYPNGAEELVSETINTTMSKMGLSELSVDNITQWYVDEVCGLHKIETVELV